MIWILIAILQGLTEFLPVSSSGHAALVDYFADSVESSRAFVVTTHLGTLLAVLIWYRKWLVEMLGSLLKADSQQLLIKLALATVPGVLAGLLIASFDIEFAALVSAVALAVGGVLFIWHDWDYVPAAKNKADRLSVKTLNSLSLRQYVLMGLAQALAIVPGVSRSGSTILAASFQGIDRLRAIDVSFLMGIPVIMGAGIYELFLSDSEFTVDATAVTGFWVSFAFGVAAIALGRQWVVRYGLKPFGYYRIALAAVVMLLLI